MLWSGAGNGASFWPTLHTSHLGSTTSCLAGQRLSTFYYCPSRTLVSRKVIRRLLGGGINADRSHSPRAHPRILTARSPVSSDPRVRVRVEIESRSESASRKNQCRAGMAVEVEQLANGVLHGREVLKSADDKKLYRFLELDNGLRAVLVHDPLIGRASSRAEGDGDGTVGAVNGGIDEKILGSDEDGSEWETASDEEAKDEPVSRDQSSSKRGRARTVVTGRGGVRSVAGKRAQRREEEEEEDSEMEDDDGGDDDEDDDSDDEEGGAHKTGGAGGTKKVRTDWPPTTECGSGYGDGRGAGVLVGMGRLLLLCVWEWEASQTQRMLKGWHTFWVISTLLPHLSGKWFTSQRAVHNWSVVFGAGVGWGG